MAVSRKSIDRHARAAHNEIVKHLKGLGVTVEDIDGPSDDAALYSLQSSQAIAAALRAHAEQKSAQAESLPASSGSWATALPLSDATEGKKGK